MQLYSYDRSSAGAINAGIKVILVDSVIDKEIANGVVATDNLKQGKNWERLQKQF